MWKLENNNVGNKLQGVLYARIDEKRCRLVVTDMFRSVYDGSPIEDSNPVGTNPFVQTTDELFFEHCADGRSLIDTASADRPESAPAKAKHPIGAEVHYHYFGEAAVEADDGCAYSMDTWAQWRPAAQGVEAPVVDGKIDWHTSHTWSDLGPLRLVNPGQPTSIFGIVRYKQCADGEKETIDVVCNAAFFEPAGEPAPADPG